MGKIIALVFAIAVFLETLAPVWAADFASFEDEIARFKAKAAYLCSSALVTTPKPGAEAFREFYFDCKHGSAYFTIQSFPHSSKVEKVTVGWDDLSVAAPARSVPSPLPELDRRYGVHADKAEAELLVKTAAALYAPAEESKLLSAFRSKTNQTINGNGFSFKFTYELSFRVAIREFEITKQ